MLPVQQTSRRHRQDSYHGDQAEPVPAAAPLAPLSPHLAASSVDTAPAGPTAVAGPDLRQCWICYTDESEDATRPFIHACQCTLLAHEQCLLDWLTAQAQTQAQAPRCPVCATPIIVREDRNDLLRLYRRLRRKADQLSLVAAVGGVAASGWLVAAAYGAWAVKVFMGDQVTQALLLRHENGLPWRYWLNLPLIPFTLILSRTPLIDSLLPFLPLTLVLSTHTHTPLFDPIGLDDLTLRYPPSPTLTVCVLPWLRLLYLRLRLRVFNAVLGQRKKFRGLAGVFEEAAEDDLTSAPGPGEEAATREPIELVATLEVDVAEERPAAPAAAAAAAQPQAVQETTTSRLRVGMGRLTSLVLGALLFPALSSLAGSALFWLAARRGNAGPLRALRAALGVSAVLAARGGPGAGGGAGGWIRQLAGAPAALRSPVVDPKWVRSTLGAGVVLLVRDACELAAGVMEQRRRASRRVVERPFRPGTGTGTGTGSAYVGTPVQPAEEAASTAVTSSGGRDAQGREAVVHTLL
ncbi:hypothetical protein JCM3770_005981 [Rhodotorula araucariae]